MAAREDRHLARWTPLQAGGHENRKQSENDVVVLRYAGRQAGRQAGAQVRRMTCCRSCDDDAPAVQRVSCIPNWREYRDGHKLAHVGYETKHMLVCKCLNNISITSTILTCTPAGWRPGAWCTPGATRHVGAPPVLTGPRS
jgi:hypothetical protein